jgi:P-type conjugative transfer protein TrbJ
MKPCGSGAASVRHVAFASAVALAALAGLADPRPARAQWAVDCVNCSTMWTQLLEYAKQAQQLATQLQQYQTELQQYANMVTNTVALRQQAWGTVQSDIMQVQSLSNAASLLSGNAGSIVTRLQSASAYADQATNLGNIAGQFTAWQQTIGNNVSTLGRTLGMQQIQATLTATAQMQATGLAVAADRRASEDAAMLHFSTPQPIQTSGYPQY